MDQEIDIINQNTKAEKIKNFFLKNLKKIITSVILVFLLIFAYFIILELKKRDNIKIAERYNQIIIKYDENKKINIETELIAIINKKHTTYSPLALYFLLDNEIIKDLKKINELFDLLINKTNTDEEIKNLLIYKKALVNSDQINENDLLNMLKPIINSDSIWKSHSLFLIAEFFYSKNEREKSKEFFSQILNLEKSNLNIKSEAQKKLNRDFK